MRSNATQATFAYNILDQPTGITLANGTSVAYNYDLLNRLTSVNNALAGSVARNYSYVYNNAGLRSSETEPRGTISYGYTNRNELNSITEPSGSPFANQSFGYDYGYNRSSWQVGTATATTYAVNNLNEYTTVSGSTAPTWTADGEVSVFGGNTYTYDSLMRLAKVTNSTGIYLFSYDPLGRRVKKVDENTSGTVLATYTYHYEESQVVVEYQPSSVTWTYYLGIGIDQDVMRVYGTTTQWYYHDALGSVGTVADHSGTVLEKYEYNGQGQYQITGPTGTVLTTTAISNYLMFTGRELDSETGNYFYRARYYNPTLGRFISRDPLSGAEFSQGTNLYAYCGNDPVNNSDPNGTDKKKNTKPPKPVRPGYGPAGSQTGKAALDTDGAGQPAVGEKTHDDTTSLQNKDGTYINGDKTPYVAQNPNPDGSYTYPPGTTVYAVNNDTGASSFGVLGDNATPNNNDTGRVEVSPAMANNLGVSQQNSAGQTLNSTNGASISVYYYPKH